MKTKLSFLALCFFLVSLHGFSTHINSAEINAKHITGNQYSVSLRILTDCAAIPAPPNVSLNFSNGTTSFNRSINQSYSENEIGMNYSCACWAASSTCNSGNFPGNNYVIYTDTVTLSNSPNWKISYSTCCRYPSVNIINSSMLGIYIETEINQSSFPSNSTPFFPLTGRLLIPVTDSFEMDLSAIDFDNDSMVYSLEAVRSTNTVTGTYNTGYSATSPISGFSLNANTGVIMYTGTGTIGDYYLAIKATEFDRVTGNIKSTILRDFGLTLGNLMYGSKYIIDAPTANGFSNLSSGVTNGNTLNICGNASSTFDLSFSSTKGNVELWSNISWEYPGVTYTKTLGATSTMTVSIPAGLNLSEMNFYVQTAADSDMFTNMSFHAYSIQMGGFSTSGDRTICLGDTVHMSATSLDPNPAYSWTFLSGTPIDTVPTSPGYSFSCANCPNPVITPTVTSQYIVNSIPNTCGQADTVTITVVQPLSLQTNMYDTICPGDSTLISVSGGMLNNLVWEEDYNNMNFSGNSMYVSPTSNAYYMIYNPNYLCGDSVYVHVIVPQNIDAGPDATVCLGSSVVLNATNTIQATWNPASSLNCTSCANPTATPSQSTMYTVSNDSYGCLSEDSVYVTVETDRYVMGTAFESNGTTMGYTKVLLIAFNNLDSTVSIADSTMTDVSGNFSFTTASDTHFIKVIPDSSTYPNEIPTYYGNQGIFLNASPAITAACDTSIILITTLSDPNPGGTGFIYGNVYQGAGKTDAAGDPATGVKIILVNENDEEIAYSETDENGKFNFSQINLGSYRLFIDALNAQNQLAPTINVDEQTMHLVYNYKLQEGALIQTSITSVNHLNKEQLVMYPNPAQKHIQIMGFSNSVSYSIIGVDGKSYKQGVAHVNTPINIEELPKGAYILKATNNTDQFIQRFIKQ